MLNRRLACNIQIKKWYQHEGEFREKRETLDKAICDLFSKSFWSETINFRGNWHKRAYLLFLWALYI